MEMMVVSAVTARLRLQGHRRRLRTRRRGPEGRGTAPAEDPVLGLMGRVSMLCNDAEIRQEDGAWKVEGDPTEGALYPFANKLGLERQAEQAAYPRIDAIPFESEHRFMATLHKDAAGKQFLLVKGAPEVDPRSLRSAGSRRRRAGAARPRTFPEGVGRAGGAGRARAGLGMARQSGRRRPGTSVRRTCRRTWFCSA